ncbi:MAG: hypothetical protein QHG98_06915 [Methanothrix sp.]|jgi:hypothetical protein|uniref:hypothetical protein n=1 Tax=Methanothrix sp. TaxID=90426 RepID=UPI00247D78C4|nr:hypothetical protein [Methanothrix sp.]
MKCRTVLMGLVICLLFVSSAYSASLAFKSIPLSSDILAVGNEAGRVNYYTSPFNLPNRVPNTDVLLVLMAYEVNDEYNFFTLNVPDSERRVINDAHYRDARGSRYYAGKLLPSGGSWATQIVPLRQSLLRTQGNILGIHTRTDSGSASGNTDDIKVTRMYLIYYVT